MENKISTLKHIRRQSHELYPGSEEFDKQFQSLSRDALECMEGINDMQEKKWIEKGLDLISNSEEAAIDADKRDRALSYLKEAVQTVILREDNYRE